MRKKFAMLLLCVFLTSPIRILADDELYLGGDSVGLQLSYDGVMISGTYTFELNGQRYDPSSNIRIKDIIQSVNGTSIHSIEDLYTQLNIFQKEVNNIPITILRDGNTINTELTTVYDDTSKAFKSGLYVKDKIAGVGTMTYFNPTNQTYGALGHEIYDNELKQIAVVYNGSIFPAEVQSLQKAQDNVPGEKHAQIDYNVVLGDVMVNTEIGIYGTYAQNLQNRVSIPWAKQNEIQVGKATMYTVLEGNKIEPFEIMITKLHAQSESSIKGIEFTVSDERLKTLTNGIIQGMSGSPIVQNGKIIGAVTHVITNHPMNGYGVYIEWMLQKSDNLR